MSQRWLKSSTLPKLHGDFVFSESEEFFAKAIGLLFRPLGSQEVFDGGGSLEEVRAVAPDAVGGIRFGYGLWVLRIPEILGLFYFGSGCFLGEGRGERHGFDWDDWLFGVEVIF